MAFFNRLSSLEKQLVGVIGGYSVVALGFSIKGEKKAPAPAPAVASVAVVDVPAVVSSPVSSGTAFDGPNDPMVLFALQDIQSRLSVIEKALKL